MVTQLTLKEVLGKAIQKETESQLLYASLSEKMSDKAAKDAFLLAANREKSSHEFYLSLAQIHPDGEVKKPVAWFSAAMTREILREFLELIKDCERNMKESVSNFPICEPHRSK